MTMSNAIGGSTLPGLRHPIQGGRQATQLRLASGRANISRHGKGQGAGVRRLQPAWLRAPRLRLAAMHVRALVERSAPRRIKLALARARCTRCRFTGCRSARCRNREASKRRGAEPAWPGGPHAMLERGDAGVRLARRKAFEGSAGRDRHSAVTPPFGQARRASARLNGRFDDHVGYRQADEVGLRRVTPGRGHRVHDAGSGADLAEHGVTRAGGAGNGVEQ